jgi:hypothetical protein
MSTGEAMDDSPNACLAAPMSGAREALIIVMLMYGLAQGCEAFAADQTANVVKEIQPIIGGKPLPMAFMARSAASDVEPSTVFQRRKSDGIDAGGASVQRESSLQAQALQTVPSWHHFADYQTQGRVQLLTLWQSPRNMVSLQTGRHGGPSLQWSSRVMNRGGATRGVLDRFVASSLGAAGLGSKSAHGPAAAPVLKGIGAAPAIKYP